MLTLEDIRKAQEVRKERREAFKALDLDQEWKDENFWKEICSEYNIRLPARYYPLATKKLRSTMRKLGVDQNWFLEHTGCTIKQFIEQNEKMPLWVGVAFIVEQFHHERTAH